MDCEGVEYAHLVGVTHTVEDVNERVGGQACFVSGLELRNPPLATEAPRRASSASELHSPISAEDDECTATETVTRAPFLASSLTGVNAHLLGWMLASPLPRLVWYTRPSVPRYSFAQRCSSRLFRRRRD